MAPSNVISEAVRLLSVHHRPVTCNEYGRPVVAGFSVVSGRDGAARISHTTPPPDLTDPERPSDDELAAARHRMVNAYAATLTTAGWARVDLRGTRSRYPYLLAGGAPRTRQGAGQPVRDICWCGREKQPGEDHSMCYPAMD